MPHKISNDKKTGFTLIELLVSITVLAVISLIGLTTYFHSQVVGRDARRKEDIRSIAVAVELYNQTYGHYPCTSGNYKISSSNLPGWISDSCPPNAAMVPRFIQNLPTDPKNSGQSVYRYRTFGGPNCNLTTDGGGFVLIATLENLNDSEGDDGNGHKLCTGANLGQGAWGANAFIVTNN